MKKSIRKPNFFIIGGPKCGTTSLSNYLRTHPQVFFSTPKELDYFNDDIPSGPWTAKNEEEYLNHFSDAKEEKIVAEGTPLYLFSDVAVPNILDFNPEAKFTVMIRNPVDMAQSLHGQTVYNLQEGIKDFKRAWKAQWNPEMRSNDLTEEELRSLQYGPICKLGEQLEELFDLVSRERVHVIIFDDFVEDTKSEYKKVLDFLGLEFDGHSEFPPANSHEEVRSHKIRKIHKFISRDVYRYVEPISEYIKDKFGIERWGVVSQFLRNLNTSDESNRDSLDPDFRQELQDYFKKDVELLSSLLDRDLTNWLED